MESMNYLIVDDEENIRKVLSSIVLDEGFQVDSVESAELAQASISNKRYDAIFLDVWLPVMDGLKFLEVNKDLLRGIPVVMISGHGTIEMAVQALKLGAFDFIEKPLSLDRISSMLKTLHKLYLLTRENEDLKAKYSGDDMMVGESPAVGVLRHLMKQAAQSAAPVFIYGENGSGKELVARNIHKTSPRTAKPFIAVNCAAIPETLIESELFGYEKGAFTGAVSLKKGRFELAHEGTLFLDEVLDLSAPAQAKLLRVLQDMSFVRIGGEKSVKVDVRIIAASNKNIIEEVRSGRFREDLYYRLHVLPIQVPSLRERRSDIPLLIRHFIVQDAEQNARAVPVIDDAAKNALSQFDWPGNIRQLKNITQRLMVMCDESISHKDVIHALGQDGLLGAKVEVNLENDEFWDAIVKLDLQEAKDMFERRFLQLKLEEHAFNITRTAQSLAMYPSNLHAKIKKYRLER